MYLLMKMHFITGKRKLKKDINRRILFIIEAVFIIEKLNISEISKHTDILLSIYFDQK